MTLDVVYHPLAATDLYDAWSWYETHQPGLGDRFVEALDAAIDRIARWPRTGSPAITVEGDVVERRTGTAGFPYLIRFRIVENDVVITAVYHERRHPSFGGDRLG